MHETRIYDTCHNLGIIQIIPSESNFPWGIFAEGEINCAYQLRVEDYSFNDIRIWINENTTKMVYLYYSNWAPCKFAFTDPEDAATFALKFGDVIKRLVE